MLKIWLWHRSSLICSFETCKMIDFCKCRFILFLLSSCSLIIPSIPETWFPHISRNERHLMATNGLVDRWYIVVIQVKLKCSSATSVLPLLNLRWSVQNCLKLRWETWYTFLVSCQDAPRTHSQGESTIWRQFESILQDRLSITSAAKMYGW